MDAFCTNIRTHSGIKNLLFAQKHQRGEAINYKTERSLRNENVVCFKVKRLYLPTPHLYHLCKSMYSVFEIKIIGSTIVAHKIISECGENFCFH